MALIQASRRGFLTGLGAVLCAPAIVRAASLMPVSSAKLVLPAPAFMAFGSPSLLAVCYPMTRLDVLHGHQGVNPAWLFDRAVDSLMSSMFADQVLHPSAEEYRARAARDMLNLAPECRQQALVNADRQFRSGVPELTKFAMGLPV